MRATARRTSAVGGVPGVLAVAAVLSQVAYPLTPTGRPRDLLTIASVAVFCAASVSHAVVHRGAAWAALFTAVTAGGGLVVEAVGTATGVPFGAYAYADSLGPRLADVPLVIPLAWTMIAYPAYLVALRIGGPVVAVAGVALASWDLFLDPQMVDAGHWSFADPTPALPGVPGIPLTNYAGWLATAVVMMAVVRRLLPTPVLPADVVPYALYLWTFASSVLASAAFWGRPAVAVWGALGMGPVVVALVRTLRRRA